MASHTNTDKPSSAGILLHARDQNSEGAYLPSAPAPIHMLAFDHRQVLRDMLGRPGEDEAAERQRLSDGKSLVVESLLQLTRHGIPGVGVLVDEEYGAEAAYAAKERGISLAMPVEASRTTILEYQYGDDYPQHVESFRPDIVKLLVFHNPDDPVERAQTQIDRTLEVSQWCASNGYPFMLEMLVPPTEEQLSRVGGSRERFYEEMHTELLRTAVEQYQKAGIEPALWKVEGLPKLEDFELIARQARSGNRSHVGCIVLGNGASIDRVKQWLVMAAAVEGFTGFAVGRSIWHEPLRAYYFDGVSREETREKISESFTALVNAFQHGQ